MFARGLCRAVSRGRSGTRVFSAAGRQAAAAPQPHEQASTLQDEIDTFRAADLIIERSVPQVQLNLADVKFGTVFSDHMFTVEHVDGQGWGTPSIGPFQGITIHPASPVLHYGLCCFEGMKAYAAADGSVRLFRPDMNMARMQRSAARLELAAFDPEELLKCLKELLRVDADWVPRREGYSMYIRPFAFATSHTLGVHRPTRSMMSVVMCPVGPYFPSGLQPISLFVDEVHRRAWPGGVGDAKVGSNYAPTIQPQVQAAAAHGTPQVVYTFASPGAPADEAVFEECGSMNIMFLLDKGAGQRELVTPPLDGTILPGVTRDSILALARSWEGLTVSERNLSIAELRAAAEAGRLVEVFGCGTACIVQPISTLVRANGEVFATVGDGSFVQRVHRILTDIQYGRVDHPWSVSI